MNLHALLRACSLFLLLCGGLLATEARAEHAPDTATGAQMQSLERKIYVGVGGGYEAGNGIRVGGSIGRHGLESGFGITYSGETGEMNYSVGARYLNTLYEGAYAWVGAGKMGHRRASDRASLQSVGAGLGIAWHLGPMFQLMLDSGWHLYSDSDLDKGTVQINPTLNAAVVYIW